MTDTAWAQYVAEYGDYLGMAWKDWFKKAAVVALTQVSALWERRMLRYK
jgi:hypothetical protein